jgi:DNA-binding transcriptional MerR regulator
MRIEDLAEATDTPVATIRFCEREGLSAAAQATTAAPHRHIRGAH